MATNQREQRRHDGEGDDGSRTPFQRDRDAILYSTAFRRLAGVTQVVSPVEGQIYHNRLTHTLEVAQIARRLAEKLASEQHDLAEQYALNADVVETAALAHDLGHPPFGHVAEKELNELVLAGGVADGYEGNAQSFRITTKLSVRNREHSGLNLTRASLNAILKYPRFQQVNEAGKQTKKKWGVYQSESEDFDFAREDGPDGDQQSLEAQIMDWADDIAYSIHDTEDFYRAGLLPLGILAVSHDAREEFLESVFLRWMHKGIDVGYAPEDLAGAFRDVCSSITFHGHYEATRDRRADLRTFTSDYIGLLVNATTLNSEPDELGNLLQIDDAYRMSVIMLKELTWHFVIKNPSLIGMQRGQREALRTLFAIFAEATHSNDSQSDWRVLPVANRSELEFLHSQYGNEIPNDLRVRVAADAVAGMTDQQAILMYHRLIGVSSGSVLDAIVI